MRSRELDHDPRTSGSVAEAEWDRFDAIQGRLTAGEDPAALAAESGVHPWFVDEWRARRPLRARCSGATPVEGLVETDWRRLKALGLADARIAALAGSDEAHGAPAALGGGRPAGLQGGRLLRGGGRGPGAVLLLDLRARGRAARAGSGPTVIILGAGPNRIGQGIEFDYCCVQAVLHVPRAGLRGGDGQLQPRDRLDRRRDLRPPLLRAARRSRTCSRWSSASGRSASSSVRRPDAASARAPPRGGRRADPRHAVRRDRRRRGP